jgi:hypothetical protein
MEEKETKTYKTVVVNYGNCNTVICGKTSCRPLYEVLFENATLTFVNGTLTIEGDCVEFGIEFNDHHPSYFEYDIEPYYIEKTRFLKRDVVRAGWHKKKERVHKKVTVNNFCIIEQ